MSLRNIPLHSAGFPELVQMFTKYIFDLSESLVVLSFGQRLQHAIQVFRGIFDDDTTILQRLVSGLLNNMKWICSVHGSKNGLAVGVHQDPHPAARK